MITKNELIGFLPSGTKNEISGPMAVIKYKNGDCEFGYITALTSVQTELTNGRSPTGRWVNNNSINSVESVKPKASP